MIDLNLLLVLDAVLDERNVTRAGARLGYTQPTVSGMLSRLRDLFDDPLFVRAQRGLLPTPPAQALAVPLKQLLADSQRLVARKEFDPAVAEATFTIASNDYMQLTLLVPFVKVMRSEAKQIRLGTARHVRPAQAGGQALPRLWPSARSYESAVTNPILRLSAPELSHNIIQKGLAIIGDWSGTVVKSRRHEGPGRVRREQTESAVRTDSIAAGHALLARP